MRSPSHGAGLDGTAAREPELADRLDRTGRLLGSDRRLPGEDLAGGSLSVHRVGLPAPISEMGVGLVDLDHAHTRLEKEPGQAGTIAPG
jgi:hypothetical protein